MINEKPFSAEVGFLYGTKIVECAALTVPIVGIVGIEIHIPINLNIFDKIRAFVFGEMDLIFSKRLYGII